MNTKIYDFNYDEVVTSAGTIAARIVSYDIVFGDGAASLSNDVVTNAVLANVATSTIKGRLTAGTGDPEDLSASQVRAILNVADGAQVNTVTSVASRTGAVVLAVADVTDAVATSDARLSDARTPTAHTHGNITNGGLVGTASNLPLKTGTGGIVEAGAFGTTSGTFSEGSHTHSAATQSVAGFLSTTDKTKLDGIASSANNYVHPNHSGDVTSSGDGATTITNDAVTNAKLANVATQTIKGRATASTGDPEDLTATQVRTVIELNTTDSVTFANLTLTGALTIASSSVPAAINSTGVVGRIAFSNNFLYICVATNTWRRVQLGTWD